MIDDQTSTVWSHLGGKALMGPLEGSSMEVIPLNHATWAKWKELHPDTLVLSPDTQYQSRYRQVRIGAPGVPDSFLSTFVNIDDRLPGNTLVVGVAADDKYRAYPLATVQRRGGVINDELGGIPIVVIFDVESAFTLAYSSRVAGLTLQFEADPSDGLRLKDGNTGTIWGLDGRALEGALQGHTLDFVPSYITEWYGWSAYHPSTDIYQ